MVALRLRIEHARELLRTTDLPQRDIAQYCGFADVHHFSKAFKRLTRLPPGAYRTAYSAYRQSCHSNELRCRRTLVFSAPPRLPAQPRDEPIVPPPGCFHLELIVDNTADWHYFDSKWKLRG